MPLATSPIRPETLCRPNSSTAMAITMIQCATLMLPMGCCPFPARKPVQQQKDVSCPFSLSSSRVIFGPTIAVADFMFAKQALSTRRYSAGADKWENDKTFVAGKLRAIEHTGLSVMASANGCNILGRQGFFHDDAIAGVIVVEWWQSNHFFGSSFGFNSSSCFCNSATLA